MNMSYTRFHNTLIDLRDCYEHIDDKLSEEEQKRRAELIMLCRRIADDYTDEETVALGYTQARVRATVTDRSNDGAEDAHWDKLDIGNTWVQSDTATESPETTTKDES